MAKYIKLRPNTISLSATQAKNDGKVLEIGPLEYAFPCSKSKILDFLCVFQDYDYSVSEIARNSGVSFKTALGEIRMLAKDGIVVRTRVSGRSHMYKLNPDSAQAKAISSLALEIAISKKMTQGARSDRRI